MGLPHVLVRFYTNPDGRAARRTTLVVLCLLGAFYLFPTLAEMANRVIAQERRPQRPHSIVAVA
jgi:Na+(H+)/acetate symporter ActP